MNGFDMAALAVLAAAAAIGALLGVVRLVLGLAALATATGLAIAFAEPAAARLAPHVGSPEIASIVGFLVVYTLVLIGFALSAWLIRKSLASLGIGWLDRVAGGLIGGAAAVVAVAGMAYGLRAVRPDLPVLASSTTHPYFVALADAAIARLPEPWRQRIEHIGRSAAPDRRRRAPAGESKSREGGS